MRNGNGGPAARTRLAGVLVLVGAAALVRDGDLWWELQERLPEGELLEDVAGEAVAVAAKLAEGWLEPATLERLVMLVGIEPA
jgi:hypothetical protein